MKKQNVFKPITFSRLRKDEFSYLLHQVVRLTLQEDSESLQLKYVCDELLIAHEQVKQIIVPVGKHSMTAEVVKLRKSRKYIIEAILGKIKSYEKMDKVYAIPELKLLKPQSDRFLKPTAKARSVVQTARLGKMFRILDSSIELQIAIEELKLTKLVEELRKANRAYYDTEIARVDTRIRKQVVTSEVRAIGEKALRNLMKEIELARLKYNQSDYDKLIVKMNELFTLYSSQVKARRTISQKKRLSKENVARPQKELDPTTTY